MFLTVALSFVGIAVLILEAVFFMILLLSYYWGQNSVSIKIKTHNNMN